MWDAADNRLTPRPPVGSALRSRCKCKTEPVGIDSAIQRRSRKTPRWAAAARVGDDRDHSCFEARITEGETPALRIILEWPSVDAAKAFLNDPNYAPLLAARHAGSISHHVIIDGVDDLA